MPFTDKQISALRPKPTRYELPEPGRTGLHIRVSPHGVKSWTWRYRYRNRHKRMLFGGYPALSLADVRLKVAEALKHLREGRDPGALVTDARQALRTAPTVGNLAHEYLTRHAERTMRPATVREDKRILEKEILPVWRDRLAKEISRQDVMTLLNAIEDRGVYVMRNRVAGVLSRLFLFGLDQGMVDASPAVQLRRLKKVGDVKVEQPRSRFLSKDEIRSFWLGLDTIPIIPAMRAALKWALVTGQRRSEVTGTHRNEIDDATRLWTLPGTRTKNQREQCSHSPLWPYKFSPRQTWQEYGRSRRD